MCEIGNGVLPEGIEGWERQEEEEGIVRDEELEPLKTP